MVSQGCQAVGVLADSLWRRGRGLSFSRFSDDTTTTGALDAQNSYTTAAIAWADILGRVTRSVNYGREDEFSPIASGARYVFYADGSMIDENSNGVPDIAEGSAPSPNSSDNYMVSETQYNAAGRAYRQIDNAGRISQTQFDLLGRATVVIQNYVDGQVSQNEASDTDQTIQYEYDGKGRLATQIALNPKGLGNPIEYQKTRYLYASPLNASWQTAVAYPGDRGTDTIIMMLTDSVGGG